jgi:hypothetical protein
MRLRELFEDSYADPKKMPKDQVAAIKGAVSMPDISINKSNGNPYKAYRFGLAMAGAPEFPTIEAGGIAGDPLLSTYTDEEMEIMKYAAKQVGAGRITKISSNRSEELPEVNKTSITNKPKKNKYGI